MHAPPRPVLIVGPGAIGGVLAARWAKALPVAVLGRSASVESKIERNGLTFIQPDGSRRKVKEISSARLLGPTPAAAIFLCVKSGDVRQAASQALPWIGPETTVVALQNGVGHEAPLRRAFGTKRTVIAACYFAADRHSPLEVAHTGGSKISLAANAHNRGALRTAKALLEKGGWTVEIKSDEDRMLWTKLVFNSAVNALGAVSGATNGQLAEDPALRRILLAVLDESLAVARKSGHRTYHSNMKNLLLKNCLALPKQRNSMLQDLQAGRKTESSAILGPLLAASRRAKTPAPILSALNRVIDRLGGL